jgi:hypothetical protein
MSMGLIVRDFSPFLQATSDIPKIRHNIFLTFSHERDLSNRTENLKHFMLLLYILQLPLF